ncbi:MAG: hypothetical protein K8F30_14605, partial [Taibaiella sp.]|nr:hypothetical protein [Taibaiella sp.]
YTQLQNNNAGFVSAFYQPADTLKGCKLKPNTFIGQLACQHIPAYAAYFNIGDFQAEVAQVLNMQSPYFSEGFMPAQITNKGDYPVLNSLVLNKTQGVASAK